ncbi:ATP-binding protein [Pseudomonas entomophila]|uniref:PAS domain-containing sensor histidine kinase n=1 Tax=Pseudomonas entomophila TaxID=312306 RepID=UPI0023D88E4A|nr:PAS domain-containing sensor histidine kinase [Pseudomonas entomophila]MDF0733730.1 ATP-binding protein [Pseudomonas entomophila]
MSGLFDRWRGGQSPAHAPELPQTVGLQLWLDDQARVLRLAGPLRSVLALPAQRGARVHDYLERHSWLVLEGEPADWQGQPLDLDFHTVIGHPLHTRGWLLRQADGWLLQMFDIGDLLRASEQDGHRQALRQLAARLGRAMRECGDEHLEQAAAEQLQHLASHWHAGAVRLMLREASGWRCLASSDVDWPWAEDARLQPWLDTLPPQGLLGGHQAPELLALCGGLSLFMLAYVQGPDVQAWLLCAGADQPPTPDEAQALLPALAEPLLARHRQLQLARQAHHLDDLQRQLGAGWWEWPLQGPLHLDPTLAASLGLAGQPSLEQWLARVHPADREAAQMALEQAREGRELSLSLRLLDDDGLGASRWMHWVGQLQGRQLRGFVLDISALKAQEHQAGAARARLENLIASSPAVIYVQRYAEGALYGEFFSASLTPLLGWAADSEQARQPGLAVHPDDHAQWLERTRSLLRDGQVRCRYRLRDQRGGYHWVLDEARLLRNDLGQPLEVVGLWLDVSEATEAAERVRQSEERYRVLVEDSPAMICRYRPDLSLVFGNRPLADHLECEPAQLAGMNLGQWLSPAEREAFVERLAALTPEQPLSSAEICLQLPGREHAWWVWADRGLFDAQGQLVEIQAVGRDNTEVRRSQRQLLQGAKMATLGELASGLVHEINQPLNVMRMAVANTLKRLENGAADAAYLNDKLRRIEAQVERAARLVEHMRVFGRRSEVERQPFPAWAAVEGAVALLEEGLRGKGVGLRIEPPVEQPVVLGHQDQLEQVLINLMVNARDALLEHDRDTPWIGVRQHVADGQLYLLVEDNGGGIDPRLLERIFEPFFTTKPAGVGTGLGLSVSHGIVAAMGGSLGAVNEAQGACFRVSLPLHIAS